MPLVQASSKFRFANQTVSTTFSLAATPVAGNAVILPLVHFASGGTVISGITIGGQLMVKDVSAPADATQRGEIWRIESFSGSSASVVISYPGGIDNFVTGGVIEWAGIVTPILDVTATATATGTAQSVTSAISSQANTLVVGVNNASSGANSGVANNSGLTDIFFEIDGNTWQGGAAGYKVASSIATQTASWTTIISLTWGAGVAVYKISAPGPAINVQPQNAYGNIGGTTSATVTATGSGSLSYQVQKRDSAGVWNNFGASSASNTFASGTLAQADNGTAYRFVVTDTNGSTTSGVFFTFLSGQNTARGRSIINGWAYEGKSRNVDALSLLRKSMPLGDIASAPAKIYADWFGYAFIQSGISVNLTEAANASDAVAASLIAVASLIEGAIAADVSGAQLIALGAITEAATATDSAAAQLLAVGSIIEPATAADSITATAGGTLLVSESASAAETIAAQVIFVAALGEATTATDSAATQLQAVSSIIEPATAADSITATAGGTLLVSESASAADTIAAQLIAAASITEAANATDSAAAQLQTTGSVSEAANATDTSTASTGGTLLVSESANAADAIAAQLIAATALSESATATDSIAAQLKATGTISEPSSAADSVIATAIGTLLVSEPASASDAVASQLIAAASLIESATASDFTIAQILFSVNIVESSTAADAVTSQLQAASNITEPAAATDSITVTAGGTILVSELATATDAITAQLIAAVAISETGNASDAIAAQLRALASVAEPAAALDAITALAGGGTAQITESGNANDSIAVTFISGSQPGESGGGYFLPRNLGVAIKRDKQGRLITSPAPVAQVVSAAAIAETAQATDALTVEFIEHPDNTARRVRHDTAAAAFVSQIHLTAAAQLTESAIQIAAEQRAAHQAWLARDDEEFLNEM